MFEWAKKGGALTEHTRGIVFGLHLAGWSVPDIADKVALAPLRPVAPTPITSNRNRR